MGRRIHLIVCIFTVRFKHPHTSIVNRSSQYRGRAPIPIAANAVRTETSITRAICNLQSSVWAQRHGQEGTAGRKAKRGGKNLAPSAWAVCAAGPLQAEPLPGILGRRCQVLLFFFYFWFLVLLQMPFPGGVRVFAGQIAETVLARGIYSRSIYSRMRWPTLWLFSGSTHSDKTFW